MSARVLKKTERERERFFSLPTEGRKGFYFLFRIKGKETHLALSFSFPRSRLAPKHLRDERALRQPEEGCVRGRLEGASGIDGINNDVDALEEDDGRRLSLVVLNIEQLFR